MSLFSGKKRAQAAVELLTTYGWAIMGVILVVGALSYFDVFDAKRFVSERCDTGNQIQCLEAYANSNGEFQIALRNNYLVSVVVEEIYVNGVLLDYSEGSYPYTYVSGPMTMNTSNISMFGTSNVGKLEKGDKKTFDILIVFRRDVLNVNDCNDGICYNISGTAVVKVQDFEDSIVPIN